MPREATVQAFMAEVESGDMVGAIERYYHAEASMQENNEAPRKGRDALVAYERQVMAAARSITPRRLSEPFINGDQVAIRWRFDFVFPDGKGFTLEEMAVQRWRDERILEEKFFYDPKQMGR